MINIDMPSLKPFFTPVKTVAKYFEPYQPLIATSGIVTKLSWRVYKQKQLSQELSKLDKRLGVLKGLKGKFQKILEEKKNDKDFDSITLTKSMNKLDERTECLKAEREEISKQLSFAYFTFSQIPSLFFDHPGSNPYQSLHQMLGRTVQMSSDGCMNWTNFAAGLISLAGTAASLSRMTGFVESNNPTSHYLSYLAIGLHTVEGAFIAINAAKNYLPKIMPSKSTKS